MPTKRERYRGALVGVLAGDALLAPYETWKALAVAEDLRRRDGLVPFEYEDPWHPGNMFPAGRPTDDSDQTAALAESLIACRGLKEEDLFNRLRNVTFNHVSPLWEGKAVGAGTTTRNALRPQSYAESQARTREGTFPSNGSLMRSAPLALYFGSIENIDTEMVRRMSEVTHWHLMAYACCAGYIGSLVALLEEKEDEMFTTAWKCAGEHSIAPLIYHVDATPRDPEEWPGRGAADLTLHIAWWSLLNSTDFRDGLTKIAMIGGDTDTYGAVAGALLGAKYGLQGIPKEWRDVLLGYDKMISLADQIYEMRHH